MKFKTYFLILLCFQLASSEIKEYEARYSYESDEISINGIRKFEKVDDNFVLSFKARNIIAKMTFVSTFSMINENITTKNYLIQVRPKFLNRDQELNFDHNSSSIKSDGRDSWESFINKDLKPMDPLNAQIQIRLNLLNNMKEFSINLVEIKNGAVEENFYKIVGKEICNLGASKYECIILKRQRKKESRETLYYLAPELDYMFLKIIDTAPERSQKLKLIEILSLG
jgi:hypothetical protein|tara:strand:- start:2424 stop:3104 length:681 start_codon:yes stop_codon:yes gene_type:complete